MPYCLFTIALTQLKHSTVTVLVTMNLARKVNISIAKNPSMWHRLLTLQTLILVVYLKAEYLYFRLLNIGSIPNF